MPQTALNGKRESLIFRRTVVNVAPDGYGYQPDILLLQTIVLARVVGYVRAYCVINSTSMNFLHFTGDSVVKS